MAEEENKDTIADTDEQEGSVSAAIMNNFKSGLANMFMKK